MLTVKYLLGLQGKNIERLSLNSQNSSTEFRFQILGTEIWY